MTQSLADYLNSNANLSDVRSGQLHKLLGLTPAGQGGSDYGYTQPDPSSGVMGGWSLSPEVLARLQGYTIGDAARVGDNGQRAVFDASGKQLGQGVNERYASNPWDTIIPAVGWAAIGSGFGAGLAGLGSGGAAGAGSAAAGAGAADAGMTGLASNAGWSAAADSLAASNALGITGGQAAAAATMPAAVNMGSLGGIMSTAAPSAGAGLLSDAATFRPSVDSQAANSALGYGGADIAAKAPATVNMGSLGGTTATAGGARGLLDVAAQKVADATASDQIGGSLLSKAGQAVSSGTQTGTGAAGDLASWLKANKTEGKLLLSGLGALLGNVGGGSSTPAAAANYGPARQWSSPITAAMPMPQQQTQQAPQMGGLLSGVGQANDGAWRYLRGK